MSESKFVIHLRGDQEYTFTGTLSECAEPVADIMGQGREHGKGIGFLISATYENSLVTPLFMTNEAGRGVLNPLVAREIAALPPDDLGAIWLGTLLGII